MCTSLFAVHWHYAKHSNTKTCMYMVRESMNMSTTLHTPKYTSEGGHNMLFNRKKMKYGT
jgi:hypothetical protein